MPLIGIPVFPTDAGFNVPSLRTLGRGDNQAPHLPGIWNIMDYGGIPNDSSGPAKIANRLAIIAAMQDMDSVTNVFNLDATVGYTLYAPAGNWYFDDTVRVNRGIHLLGAGPARNSTGPTTFIVPTNKAGIEIVSAEILQNVYSATRASNVTTLQLGYAIASASRTGGVVTLTINSALAPITYWGAGIEVYVRSTNINFVSGVYTLTSPFTNGGTSTLTYTDGGANIGATANIGAVLIQPPNAVAGHNYYVGQEVDLNSSSGSFSSGFKIVTAATEYSLSYADPGVDVGPVASIGYTTQGEFGGGQHAVIENLVVKPASTGTDMSAHGLRMRTTADIRNCWFLNFSGNGIDIEGSVPWYNMNAWRVSYCTATNNSGHGMFITGGDVNAGHSDNFSASLNQGYGIYDGSFLGNAHYTPNTVDNGLGASALLRVEYPIASASRTSNVTTVVLTGHVDDYLSFFKDSGPEISRTNTRTDIHFNDADNVAFYDGRKYDIQVVTPGVGGSFTFEDPTWTIISASRSGGLTTFVISQLLESEGGSIALPNGYEIALVNSPQGAFPDGTYPIVSTSPETINGDGVVTVNATIVVTDGAGDQTTLSMSGATIEHPDVASTPTPGSISLGGGSYRSEGPDNATHWSGAYSEQGQGDGYAFDGQGAAVMTGGQGAGQQRSPFRDAGFAFQLDGTGGVNRGIRTKIASDVRKNGFWWSQQSFTDINLKRLGAAKAVAPEDGYKGTLDSGTFSEKYLYNYVDITPAVDVGWWHMYDWQSDKVPFAYSSGQSPQGAGQFALHNGTWLGDGADPGQTLRAKILATDSYPNPGAPTTGSHKGGEYRFSNKPLPGNTAIWVSTNLAPATPGDWSPLVGIPISVSNQLIGSAATPITIIDLVPVSAGNYEVSVYYTVETGATDVEIQIDYTDANGAVSYDLVNSPAVAVGSYPIGSMLFNATTATNITITATASDANRLRVSCVLKPLLST